MDSENNTVDGMGIATAVGKVWTPTVLFLGVITMSNAKDFAVLIGAIVTMGCTVLVTRHQLRK